MFTKMMLVVVAMVLIAVCNVQAITIGFETAEGYTQGADLIGLGSSTGTKWEELDNPHREGMSVVGEETNQYIRSNATPIYSANAYYQFAQTDAELGTTFNGSSSILNFSFKRSVENDIGDNGTDVQNILIGGAGGGYDTAAVFLFFYSDGRAKYVNAGQNYGGSSTYVLNALGGEFNPSKADGWILFEGQINYATKTYTLTVNGVAQNGGNGIGFQNATTNGSRIHLINNNTQSSNYVQYNMDDLTLQNIPEPATLCILALGGLLGLRRKNR